MKNFMCTRCHKRPAVIFMSRMENGQMVNEGLCLQCAKELGIPQVKDLIDRMGISDEDIESMSNQIMDMMGDETDSNRAAPCRSGDEYVRRPASAGGGKSPG